MASAERDWASAATLDHFLPLLNSVGLAAEDGGVRAGGASSVSAQLDICI